MFKIRNLYALIGLGLSLLMITPITQTRIGFGFGVGGRHGGLSFGVGRPYGHWGHGYGHRYWGPRRWYGGWDYDYPRTQYVVRENPVTVQYVSHETASPENGIDRKGKDYWRISNKTDMDITIISDTDKRDLRRDDRHRKLFREDDYTIKIQTSRGKSASFTNVYDHNADIVIGKDGSIELETWNE